MPTSTPIKYNSHLTNVMKIILFIIKIFGRALNTRFLQVEMNILKV